MPMKEIGEYKDFKRPSVTTLEPPTGPVCPQCETPTHLDPEKTWTAHAAWYCPMCCRWWEETK